jgi:hypothetical protein
VGCQQVAHVIERGRGGFLRLREPRVNRVLGLLIKVECAVQIPRQEIVSGLIGGSDDLCQKLQGQGNLTLLGGVRDDLGEDNVGYVLAGAPVHHADIAAIANHAGDVLQLHIATGIRIVEPPIAVFADENFRVFHIAPGGSQASDPGFQKELDTGETGPYREAGYCNAVYRGMRGDSIMIAKGKKSPRASPPANPLMGWARQGIESFVAAQKIVLDLAGQENALLVGMVRENLGKPLSRPGATLAGLADMGVKNVTSAGKILLDLAAGETALAVDGVKEGLRLPVTAGAVAEVARHGVDTLVGMQKHLLDAAAEQTHAMAESYQEGKGLMAGAKVVELARRGIEAFVESEKKFLDLAAHEVSAATKGGKPNGKPRERMEVLTKLARQGAEKYIDAQKRLLELAIEELKAARKTKGERKLVERKALQRSWGELTEKGVKNLVAAEKSLLDLAIKPKKRMAGEETRKSGPRARGRKVHVRVHARAGKREHVAA